MLGVIGRKKTAELGVIGRIFRGYIYIYLLVI